jgi:DMSO/TMAO reductase YedYZ molybdopterin-dependent catalytic subunit
MTRKFDFSRRAMVSRAMALGLVSALPGCDYEDPQHPDLADRFLHAMSSWNDKVQATLFDPHTLAPTFSLARITQPRFNAFYSIDQAPQVDPATYSLTLTGRVSETAPWTLAQLRTLPQHSQITRLICIEGWSFISHWSGPRLSDFLHHVGANTKCRYVSFQCADGYYGSIDMPSALHPQTILALDFLGRPLTAPFGAPVRLRIPIKLGFKNPKSITAIGVTNIYPGGYWADQGYNWFSGL